MPPPLLRLNREVVQREIARFARLLVSGEHMPVIMASVHLPSETIQLTVGLDLVQKLRADERLQEVILNQLRDALGKIIAGPDGREGAPP